MRCLLFAAVVSIASSSWGLASHRAAVSPDFAWEKNHFLSVLGEYWRYQENPDIMKDEGPLGGLSYAFKNHSGNLFYEFNAEAIYGHTTYHGHTISSGADVTADQTNLIYMGQLWLGWQIPTSPAVTLIPKIGYLYRTLIDFDDASGGDYRREERYFVVPVGLDVLIKLSQGKLAFSAWKSMSFRGSNRSNFTEIGGDRDGKFKQTSGSGYYLEGDYLFDRWIVGAYVRYWNVDASNDLYILLPAIDGGPKYMEEPDNETTAFGLKGGFTF